MKQKIVQITAIDVSMNNMLNLLNKRTQEAGYEVHCICSPGEGTKRIINNGYTYHPVKIDRKISPLSNLKSIYGMYKVIKRIKPDIVHVHTPIAAVLGRIAARLAGVKTIIYTAHGFYFHEGMSERKYKLFFNIEKYIGRYFTNYLFTQSLEDYNTAKENNFLKNDSNYLHISNGIDIVDRFNYDKHLTGSNEIRSKHNIYKNDLVITFAGRLVEEKGILDLIEVVKYFRNYNDIKFLILGESESSSSTNSINKIIKETKENISNVLFTGNVNNIEDYLFTSDIFVLPSYREGMPRSIIEAMAMKNAILATNIRGSREEVDNNVNGFLINTNDPKAMIDRILTLYSDNDMLVKMKEASHKKAIHEYNEEKVVSKQLKVFDTIDSLSRVIK